ncbi:hypothetical protein AAE026_13020 [Bradyrhizobium sp. DN5]|uniref:hypothetical protein n=1 Tax=Bradyrhizobium sp. DN5 TaxID=3056950 RepID=UPI003525FC63
MTQAIQIPTTRRQFSKWLAAATAGAATAIPATALASPDDDSALLQVEEQIFEAWRASRAHDDEIQRLDEVCRADYDRRLQEETRLQQFLSMAARRDTVDATPDGLELDRLVTLSEQHQDRVVNKRRYFGAETPVRICALRCNQEVLMSRGPHNTKQADIRKVVNGLIEGLGDNRLGLEFLRIEVERGGKIIATASKVEIPCNSTSEVAA